MIDPRIKEYATKRQAEIIDAVNREGSNNKAARALGISARSLERGLSKARKNAANSGYAPDQNLNHPTPPGFGTKGISNYYDADGVLKGQWHKLEKEREQIEQEIRELVEAASEEIKPEKKTR